VKIINLINLNRVLTIVTIAILIMAIAIPAVITVRNRHNERLLYATTMKIREKALLCFHREECLETKITLRQLYDLGYLEEIAHPITKEYYSEDSYVLINGSKTQFIEINEN